MRRLLPLLLISLAAPAFAFSQERTPPPKVFCERPRTLHLRRFEDRSARLECAGRAIVRVSVPG